MKSANKVKIEVGQKVWYANCCKPVSLVEGVVYKVNPKTIAVQDMMWVDEEDCDYARTVKPQHIIVMP